MTLDAAGAVAALVGAKDIEALEDAIAKASFLDNTPGEDRQKLRGGREGPTGRFSAGRPLRQGAVITLRIPPTCPLQRRARG